MITAADFFQGPFTTALRPDEIVTEIRIPLAGGHAGGAYHKLERKVGDFATVAVAVQVEMNGDKIAKAGIGLTSVGDRRTSRRRDAEKALVGQRADGRGRSRRRRGWPPRRRSPRTTCAAAPHIKKDVVRVFVQRGLKTALAEPGR